MRRALVQSSGRYGLIVVGYSGRDDSVLTALNEAVDSGSGYPAGLFWFQRHDAPPLSGVKDLIQKASSHGIQAELVEVQTFDELLGDIIRQFNDVPVEIQTRLDRHAARISDIPLNPPGRSWPVIRLNALPVDSWPSICRRVGCQIGGTKDVREAITAHHAKTVGVRTRAGVLAFGSDAEVRKAFSSFEIVEFDCHAIEPKKLHFDSAELGLLRDAFSMGLAASGPFTVQRARSCHTLQLDFSRASDLQLAPLRSSAGSLSGTIPGTEISWTEALRFKLDYQLGRLWVLIEPTIRYDEITNTDERYIAADFVRERLATRYNRQWNALMDAWITLIVGSHQELQISAFGISDGIDASFSIGRITAFSSRSVGR
jgi:hypothetical protein